MKPEFVTLEALRKMNLPPPKYAVEGLFLEGLNLLAGVPKCGKSWMTLGTAREVAIGGLVLGKFKSGGGDVLALCLEDTLRRIQDRINKMYPGQEWPANCTVVTEWPRLDQGGLTMLEEWLKAHPNASMVLIDTLKRIRPPRKPGGDGYGEDYDLTALLHTLAIKYHVAIVVVHHTRKMGAEDVFDQVSGSLGLNGGADAIFVLKRTRNQKEGTLHITGRDIEERELAVSQDPETCRWTSSGKAAAVELKKNRQDVLDGIRAAGHPCAPKDLADRLGRTCNGGFRNLLIRMKDEGQLIVGADGKYDIAPDPVDEFINELGRQAQAQGEE